MPCERSLVNVTGVTLLILVVLSSVMVRAEIAGTKTIYLKDGEQKLFPIGTVFFHKKENNAVFFKVDLDSSQFNDEFLSMRPFRCIDTPRERICHQPYPYPLERKITNRDYSALEYDLMFIFQTPEQFNSIDAWNGIYYRLQKVEDELIGDLQAVDLNLIMAPPDPGINRPILPTDLTPLEPDTHYFQQLIIR